MINLEYTMSAQETAESTLDFLANRPFFNILFFVMRYSCILLCFGFAITIYQHNTRPEDIAAFITACVWLFFYKSINRKIIKLTLRGRKFSDMHRNIKFDEKSIFCRGAMLLPIDIEWKKLRYVLKNKDGYIIPLTGIMNAGKFFWLPTRAFNDPQQEQTFLELLQKFKLKIKEVQT
jgi:hypothetical protein